MSATAGGGRWITWVDLIATVPTDKPFAIGFLDLRCVSSAPGYSLIAIFHTSGRDTF